jgi:release factor glutamine methyltransferase
VRPALYVDDVPTALEPVAARLRAAGCVFAEEEAALLLEAAPSAAALESLVGRRVAGEPLEHVVGWAEFCGLRIAVGPGVFVPRHRTERLVREAARLVRRLRQDRPGRQGRAVVLDLCCGSGAMGAAVAAATSRIAPVELHAADVDPVATRFARRNLAGVGGTVHEGDLFAPLPATLRGRVDVLVANVPYVPTDAIALMPPEARDHEPRRSLDGGADGLDVLRRVAADAGRWLAPGGTLLVETSLRQSATALAVVAAAGLTAGLVGPDGDEDLDEDLDDDGLVVFGTRAESGQVPAEAG